MLISLYTGCNDVKEVQHCLIKDEGVGKRASAQDGKDSNFEGRVVMTKTLGVKQRNPGE